MARLAARSSSRMACASAGRPARISSSGRPRPARLSRRMRSSAQKRLTAVGRVAPSPLMASSRSARSPSNSRAPLRRAASATPKAAATPMAGAPRTTRVRMASATSGQVAHDRSTSSRGSRVWSTRTSRSPAQRRGEIIGGAAPRPPPAPPARPAARAPRRRRATGCGRACRARRRRAPAPPWKAPRRARRRGAASRGGWHARRGEAPAPGRAARPPASPAPRRARRPAARGRGAARSSALIGGGAVLEVLVDHALVHVERGAEPLRHLAPLPLELEDLVPEHGLLGAVGLEELLALQLGLPQDEGRLAARPFLHLLGELLGGNQRLLEHLLPVLEAARAVLQHLELLLEERVLLDQRLVVLGDVLEEGVHLLDIEAAEHSHRELLLPNVHGCDAHGSLLSTATAGSHARRTGWR